MTMKKLAAGCSPESRNVLGCGRRMAIQLEQCTLLGGCGYPFAGGQRLDVYFSSDSIRLRVSEESGAAEIFYPEVVDLVVTGPGVVTTGGGFIGGGFDFEGALQGMGIAAVLNLLTTRTKVHTFWGACDRALLSHLRAASASG
jgi:hypothetical protein